MKQTNRVIFVITLFILAATVSDSQVKTYTIDLPDGATARLGKGRIHDMQYTEDGTRIAASTSMGIWIYDATTFNPLYLLRKHTKHADHLSFSPNGKILASADFRGAIHIWDIDTGKHKKKLKNQLSVLSMTFNKNGDTLGVVARYNTVLLWDTNTWDTKQEFRGVLKMVEQSAMSVAISPDNFLVGTGNLDSSITLSDPVSAVNRQMNKTHGDSYVGSVAFNQDETLLASASSGDIRIWNTKTGEQKQRIQGIRGIGRLVFSPDGNLLACASLLGKIHLFHVDTGKKFRVFTGHSGGALRIAFSSDMRTISSAGLDGSIRIWNVLTGEQIHAIEEHFGNFSCFDVSPDGKTVVAPTRDLTVCKWNLTSAKVEKTFNKEGHFSVAEIAFDPTGNIIATASHGNFISLWNSETGKLLKILRGHDDHLSSVMFSPDSRTIVSGSDDTTVRLWDTETYKKKQVLIGHEEAVTCVAYSPDGTIIASGSVDDTIRLWDADTGEEKDVLAGHESDVVDLAFSPTGDKIASVALSSEIFVWHVGSNELDKVIHAGNSTIASVVFHPKGKVVAIGWKTGDVELISVDSEQSLHKFSGHLKQVTDLGFASDGNKLVSRSSDGVLYVWDVSGVVK